jgi:hypothetical protein
VPLRRDDGEHPFPLIRSLRASAQREHQYYSHLCFPLIVAGSSVIRQSKTTGERFVVADTHIATMDSVSLCTRMKS